MIPKYNERNAPDLLVSQVFQDTNSEKKRTVSYKSLSTAETQDEGAEPKNLKESKLS